MNLFDKNPKIYTFLLFFIISCGGGGGGGESSDPPLANITITIQHDWPGGPSPVLDALEIGSYIIITWSSTLASSCSASGDWTGARLTSGSEEGIQLLSAKEYTFTLTCLNASGASSSSSKKIIANHQIVSGSIFGSNNSNLEVYIDENHNRIKDPNELSGISSDNGSFRIGTMDTTEIDCLRNRSVAVNSSHLSSINPNNESVIAISSLTSLFANNFRGEEDSYRGESWLPNNIKCDTQDNYIRNNSLKLARSEIRRMQFHDTYNYDSLNYTNSVLDSRLNDLDKFYDSVSNITSSLTASAKTYLDSLSSQDGGIALSGNFDWQDGFDLDEANLRIFLNDTSYPNPSTNPSIGASSADAITVQFNYYLDITPNDNVPEANLNGWQDKYRYNFFGLHANNASEIINSSNNCYVNFSSACKSEEGFQALLASNRYDGYETDFIMTKSTNRGTEQIFSTQQIYLNTSDYINCFFDIYYIIEEEDFQDTNSLSRTEYSYMNWHDTNFNINEEECLYTYSPVKRIDFVKRFDDGSKLQVNFSGGSIESLAAITDPSEYLSNNLPPNGIPSDVVNMFNNLPLIPKDDERDLYPTLMGATIIKLLQTDGSLFRSFAVRGTSPAGVRAIYTVNINSSGEGTARCQILDSIGTAIVNKSSASIIDQDVIPCFNMPMNATDTWGNEPDNRSPYPGL